MLNNINGYNLKCWIKFFNFPSYLVICLHIFAFIAMRFWLNVPSGPDCLTVSWYFGTQAVMLGYWYRKSSMSLLITNKLLSAVTTVSSSSTFSLSIAKSLWKIWFSSTIGEIKFRIIPYKLWFQNTVNVFCRNPLHNCSSFFQFFPIFKHVFVYIWFSINYLEVKVKVHDLYLMI